MADFSLSVQLNTIEMYNYYFSDVTITIYSVYQFVLLKLHKVLFKPLTFCGITHAQSYCSVKIYALYLIQVRTRILNII